MPNTKKENEEKLSKEEIRALKLKALKVKNMLQKMGEDEFVKEIKQKREKYEKSLQTKS